MNAPQPTGTHNPDPVPRMKATTIWSDRETLTRLDELCQALRAERGQVCSRNSAIRFLLDFRETRLREIAAEMRYE